jgi:23S rRNA pseudouridine1911/1915/1917 synthase
MIKWQVLKEDNHLLVVNKPPGLLVQGDETGDIPLVELVKGYIKEKYKKPGAVFLGVVHRLDRPVSGVVVFARTSKALARMNELFRSRRTSKHYWAITDGKPTSPEGTLVHWLVKDAGLNKTTAYPKEKAGALRAELSYAVKAVKGGYRLLEVIPITGRPHQIRVQLASIGCPIIGDIKYGSGVQTGDGSIGLHARRLEFVHPVKKEAVVVEADPPQRPWWQSFAEK